MILHPPFIISSALAPALKIGDATLSLLDVTQGERDRAGFELVTPEFTYLDDKLQSGCGGFRSTVEVFEAFLSFLMAAVESYDYELYTRGECKGENTDLFPRHVVQWAHEHKYEIEDVVCCITDEDGNPNDALIEE